MKKSLVQAVLLLAVSATAVFNVSAQKLVEITLWEGGAVSEAAPPPDDWVGYRIIRERLGIDLKLVLLPSSPSDQDTKINLAAAANQLPDLMLINQSTWYKLAKAGMLAEVTKLLPAMPLRTKNHYSDPLRNKIATFNKKLYGLADPGAMEKVEGLVIRKDWLAKLGLKVPVTHTELLEVAKAFTFNDPDGNGKADTYGFGAWVESPTTDESGLGRRFDPLTGAFGFVGLWNLDPKTFGLNVRQPAYQDALRYVKSFVDAKVIDPDWPTLKKDEFRARWKQGRFGIMREQFAALATMSNYKDFDTNFPDGEWIAIAPPKGPKGLSSQGMLSVQARIHAVSAKAAKEGKTEAIARLLEWMASEEGYYLLGFGVEGVNFRKLADGSVSLEGIPAELQYSAKAQQPLTQLRNLVFINAPVELSARYPVYSSKNGKTMNPLGFWNEFKKYPFTETTGTTLIKPPAGFYENDFKSFYSESIMKFVLGQTPLDKQNWDAFIAQLDKLGAKNYEAEARKILEEAGMF